MKVKLIQIDGADVKVMEVDSFSPADILHANCEKIEDYRRDLDDPNDVVVGISITHLEHKQTVVQFFNHDGEQHVYIGPEEYFVMDPPLDEEPAYDNYI